jgi:hypothetical protein
MENTTVIGHLKSKLAKIRGFSSGTADAADAISKSVVNHIIANVQANATNRSRDDRFLTDQEREAQNTRTLVDAEYAVKQAWPVAIDALRKQAREDGPPVGFEPTLFFANLPLDLRASLKPGTKSARMAYEICAIFGLPA